jgi:hypothetical protein
MKSLVRKKTGDGGKRKKRASAAEHDGYALDGAPCRVRRVHKTK